MKRLITHIRNPEQMNLRSLQKNIIKIKNDCEIFFSFCLFVFYLDCLEKVHLVRVKKVRARNAIKGNIGRENEIHRQLLVFAAPVLPNTQIQLQHTYVHTCLHIVSYILHAFSFIRTYAMMMPVHLHEK